MFTFSVCASPPKEVQQEGTTSQDFTRKELPERTEHQQFGFLCVGDYHSKLVKIRRVTYGQSVVTEHHGDLLPELTG